MIRKSVFAIWALVAAGIMGACAHDPAPGATAEASAHITALREDFRNPQGRVMIVAHRACWKNAPENSLKAIRDCRAIGVDVVELDVRRTLDGHLVLMHDETVDRTTNGSGRVEDLTLRQIKALRLRESGGALSDEAPPTFTEAMQAARGAFLINIDAKGDVNLQALETLETLGLLDHALIKTTQPPVEEKLLQLIGSGQVLYMPIVNQSRAGGPLPEALEAYRRFDPPAYEVVFQNDEWFLGGLGAIQGEKARVWVNTLEPHHAAGRTDGKAVADPDSYWGWLVGEGASVIQTDEPQALKRWLEGRRRR